MAKGNDSRDDLNRKVDRPSIRLRMQETPVDQANPQGMVRPRLPLSNKVSRMGQSIAEGIKGMVYGGSVTKGVEAMDSTATGSTPYSEPDPAPPMGMKRPVIKTKKD